MKTTNNQKDPDSPDVSHSVLNNLLAAIRNSPEFGPKFKELEEFDKEVQAAAGHVDLSIAYSPVILVSGQETRDAVEVYKAKDGRYVCREPLTIMSEEEARIARCRFIIQRGKEMKPFLKRFLDR